MKNISFAIVFVLTSFLTFAQAPQKINYQAVVRDANGNILPNTTVPVTITISSCTVYNGTPTTNDYGLINLELDLSNCSPAIDWSQGNLSVNSSINNISGSSNLNSVPYSLHSTTVANYPAAGNSDGDILKWSASSGEWIASTNSGGSTLISDADGDTQIQTEESTDEDVIRFDTDGQERMIIKNDGKVGISLNDPNSNLDVQDTLRVSRENRQYTEIINSGASGAIIQAISGEGNKKPLSIDALYETESTTAGANQIRFRTGEISNPSIRMLIDENGDVGIGTTQPVAKLDVRGDLSLSNPTGTSANLKITNNSSNQYSKGRLYFVNANTSVGADDSGFSINYEKVDASSTGNSTVIFRQGEDSGNYLDYLQFSETTKNITFNANKSSGSNSTFGNVKVNQGNLELNSGAEINEFSTDGLFTDNSDNSVPTEKAVKTYIENAVATVDGSETILNAGTNISITGVGTSIDPYIVNSTDNDSQTLDEVLTLGNSAGSNKITNLIDPSSAQDAATKNYVDNSISNSSNWTRNSSTFSLYQSSLTDKVGIGTSSPETMLHIGSILPVYQALHLSTGVNSTASHAVSIGFSHDNSASNSYLAAFIKAEQAFVNDNRTNLIFGTRETNSSTATASEHLVISYDGNVGIGMNSDPEFKLDLGGSAGPPSYGIRAPGLSTSIVRPQSSNSSVVLSNYDESSYVKVKDDGDIEIGNDDGTSSTEIYGTTVAKYIEATNAIGLQLKDQSGNLGIHIASGGNVGIGTLATSSKLAVDGDLDVDGKTRIGWRGYEDKIIITPSDLIIDDDNGEFSDLSYNGGSTEVSNGTDAYVNVVIPAGYYCSGYLVYFDNPMDDIEVYANDIQNSNGIQIGTTIDVSLATSLYGTTFSQSTNVEGGNDNWITFKFLNNSNHKFIFNGMKVFFTKCSSGCGF